MKDWEGIVNAMITIIFGITIIIFLGITVDKINDLENKIESKTIDEMKTEVTDAYIMPTGYEKEILEMIQKSDGISGRILKKRLVGGLVIDSDYWIVTGLNRLLLQNRIFRQYETDFPADWHYYIKSPRSFITIDSLDF